MKITSNKTVQPKSIVFNAPDLSPNHVKPLPQSTQLMHHHRDIGNQAVLRMMEAEGIQAKLKIGQPNDRYEQEADRIADQVMKMPGPGSSMVQGNSICAGCKKEEELIQSGSISNHNAAHNTPDKTPGNTPGTVHSLVQQVIGSPGQSLDHSTRNFMESRFEWDFSQVRIHTDENAAKSARAINARAYTMGNHIAFGAGQYAQGTGKGRQLLAHELTHTIQQNRFDSHKDSTTGSIAESARHKTDHFSQIANRKNFPPVEKHIPYCIQRELVEEPASGCGVCLGPQKAGTIAHTQIQTLFVAQDPLREAEEPGSMIRKLQSLGCGRPDLWRGGTDPVQIGEIKPAKKSGYQAGTNEMNKYLSCFASRGFILKPSTWIPTTGSMGIFMEPIRPPGCPQQELFVNPPKDGVYGYYCKPTFTQLKKTGKCNCGGSKKPYPVLVPQNQEKKVPLKDKEPIYEKVLKFLIDHGMAIGVALALVPVIIVALADPEPATKLLLAGLSYSMIVLLLTHLGMKDKIKQAEPPS